MATTIKPNLFEETDYQVFLNRVHQLKANSQPIWGTMNAAQMLAHCLEVQEACNGKPLQKTPFFIKLFKGFIKKSVLSDKPYPKNLQTHQQYIISDQKDFELEKKRFLASLEAFVQNKNSVEHSLFGTMSLEERNWAIYKHHNHHLEQFGV
ncbi:DUF1569 domain-containing protein [Aureispira anguillae]|uniref:DUF1569 domain-containing protein n=1 Tax=Aureispira anguillae TaxID=2864201 RepID=A0A916DQV8_9BACT|nr:DUF1569 domain-containing protein [Aureispira anguillae]BDS09851.1 DUF1569 domain-containing protein [Aureispira anguillae]